MNLRDAICKRGEFWDNGVLELDVPKFEQYFTVLTIVPRMVLDTIRLTETFQYSYIMNLLLQGSCLLYDSSPPE